MIAKEYNQIKRKMKTGIFYKTRCKSPLGILTMACDDKENLVGLWTDKHKNFDVISHLEMITDDDRKIFASVKKWLYLYFKGKNPSASELVLAPIGNAFRQEVWKILCGIPYGRIVTYGAVARKIAEKRGINKMSARAVGGAVGHNPISIIIPCHRVIAATGNLTGYAGGIKNKIKLLHYEGINVNNLSDPDYFKEKLISEWI